MQHDRHHSRIGIMAVSAKRLTIGRDFVGQVFHSLTHQMSENAGADAARKLESFYAPKGGEPYRQFGLHRTG